MKRFLKKWRWVVLFVVILIVGVNFFSVQHSKAPDRITTTVTQGEVQQIVSVSGFVEAKNTAQLAFPISGTVTDIFVDEGSIVAQGDLLATLGSSKLVAQRNDAVAQLQRAQAARDQLIEGPTPSARALTDTSIASAQEALSSTIATEAEKVKNARAALLSNELQAHAVNPDERATPPTITGSYTCQQEGTYTLTTYAASTLSGYAYTLRGLETDTAPVSTLQPAPLGSCGLLIQFADGQTYADSQWTIDIPNKKSATYISFKNAYDLALKQEQQNVQAAKDALAIAQKKGAAANAAPSSPALRQATAAVYSAQARIAQIDAQIKDLSIVAPFDGMITSVDIRPGETATLQPVITLLAQDAFELKARVPEIDITKVAVNQTVHVTFDAKTDVVLTGTISFVSPLATEIDGVAYFEALITLDEVPSWIRSGLNADIDIITDTQTNVLRIPTRYLITSPEGKTMVRQIIGDAVQDKEVTVLITGDDGYVGISGLNEADTIVAP